MKLIESKTLDSTIASFFYKNAFAFKQKFIHPAPAAQGSEGTKQALPTQQRAQALPTHLTGGRSGLRP